MPKGSFRPECSLADCDEPHAAKGYCRKHYSRWMKYGDPEAFGGRRVEQGETVKEKLTNKFLRGIKVCESGCWTCTTATPTKRGYLRMSVKHGGTYHKAKAHRFSYNHFVGSIPAGKVICHTCDNPSCCNPSHLFVGTQSDNMQDMVRKERGLVGEKNGNTRFTEADIVSIYAEVDAGVSRADIARKLGVTAVTISHIATGRNWKHLYERLRA